MSEGGIYWLWILMYIINSIMIVCFMDSSTLFIFLYGFFMIEIYVLLELNDRRNRGG